jgi:deoxyribodipyrimidine photolyase-related protein
MPEYSESNYFGAKNKLPEFFWDGKTELNCLHQVVADTKRTAYAHHIQRLMVTGNFALLAGITPAEIEEWYLIVYADALDWVELPNVHGMVLHADGGILGSKPYAASGAYINRMSDYCRECKFSPKEKLGEQACPFNYLYWNFLIQNEETLGGNPRMQMPYRNLRRMPDERREEIVRQSNHFLREHQIMVSE